MLEFISWGNHRLYLWKKNWNQFLIALSMKQKLFDLLRTDASLPPHHSTNYFVVSLRLNRFCRCCDVVIVAVLPHKRNYKIFKNPYLVIFQFLPFIFFPFHFGLFRVVYFFVWCTHTCTYDTRRVQCTQVQYIQYNNSNDNNNNVFSASV